MSSTAESTLSPVATRIAERKRAREVVVERSIDLRDRTGKVVGSVELPGSLFGIEPNLAVVHQVVTAQMAGARAGSHSTKRRSEVRGGGRKPWRQKGTGRARQGSIRAAQWVGGGIAMGPKPRDYSQSTPKKMVRLALASALSDRAASGRICAVSTWDFEAPRTREAVAALEALKLSGKVLLVLGQGGAPVSAEDQVAFLSFANLPDVAIVQPGSLTAWDVLRSDWLVFTRASLEALTGGPSTASSADGAGTVGSADGAGTVGSADGAGTVGSADGAGMVGSADGAGFASEGSAGSEEG